MFKKGLFIILALCFFSTAMFVFSQPSIAFLDAVLDTGVDPAVQGPVTEKIIQELVASGKYTVLDRAHVAQVLREKQFQLSGMVQDSEIKQAGVYLGAAFVGVSRVAKVGNMYFISAKIINVETGAIAAQTSGERQGNVEVVLAIATDVGRQLAGGRVEKLPSDQQVTQAAPQPPKQPERVTPEAKKPSDNKPKARAMLSYMVPVFAGDHYDFNTSVYDSAFISGYTLSSVGADFHYLQPLFSIFYASFGVSISAETVISDYTYDEYDVFSLLDARFNVGAVLPVGQAMQVYGGVGLGYLSYVRDDGEDAFYTYSATESGVSLCLEVGADLFLLNFISLGARMQLSSASMTGTYTEGDTFGCFGICFGAGIKF